jgi:hypothetical protein
MREFLKPVVKASRELSRPGNLHDAAKSQTIVRGMRAGLGMASADWAASDSGAESTSSRT